MSKIIKKLVESIVAPLVKFDDGRARKGAAEELRYLMEATVQDAFDEAHAAENRALREFVSARYNAASVKDEKPDAAAALAEVLEFMRKQEASR